MLRTTKRAQYPLMPSPKRRCPAGLLSPESYNAKTLDDEFVVHDIKVIEGEKGLFIAMPSKKASDGEYRDIAHPINSDTRDRIQSLPRF